MKPSHKSVIKFFSQVPCGNELHIIDNTIWNYFCFICGAVGLICCLQNQVTIAVVVLLTVFIVMNLKLIVYYKIYRQYQNNHYIMELDGSKYSFAYPKTLIIKRK